MHARRARAELADREARRRRLRAVQQVREGAVRAGPLRRRRPRDDACHGDVRGGRRRRGPRARRRRRLVLLLGRRPLLLLVGQGLALVPLGLLPAASEALPAAPTKRARALTITLNQPAVRARTGVALRTPLRPTSARRSAPLAGVRAGQRTLTVPGGCQGRFCVETEVCYNIRRDPRRPPTNRRRAVSP